MMSTSQRECACDLDWSTGEYAYCRGNSPDCPVRFLRQLRTQRAPVTQEGDTGGDALEHSAERYGLEDSNRLSLNES